MRKIFATFLFLLFAGSLSAASPLKIGVRGGVALPGYQFNRFALNGTDIAAASHPVGWQVALVTRLTIPHFIHISPEMVYASQGYRYLVNPAETGQRKITITSRRLELPVMIGFNIYALRIFAGPVFCLSHKESSNGDARFAVRYNSSDIALMAGVGLDIRKFFVDVRYTTYTKDTYNTISWDGRARPTKVGRNNAWTFSAGFFF